MMYIPRYDFNQKIKNVINVLQETVQILWNLTVVVTDLNEYIVVNPLVVVYLGDCNCL